MPARRVKRTRSRYEADGLPEDLAGLLTYDAAVE